jgi:hypothetical protein
MRCEWTVNAIAVKLSGLDVGQIPVPHHVGVLGKGNRYRFELRRRGVKQAQFDAGRMLGKKREIDPDAVPGRAKRIRRARPDT